MFEKIYRLLRPGESAVQAEILDESKAAVLTILGERYYFYLETDSGAVETREVDCDKVFDLARIADWTRATMKLSKKKQRMRIPKQCVMRAVGFRPEDVDLFLNNETKSGLVAKLRKAEWYKNTHHEIQTAALKLFAHLGLFEQGEISKRLEVVERVNKNFTLLEIHNLFGGLRPGTSLKHILLEQDLEQSVDPSLRKRFDPTGKKAIEFFLNNMGNPSFKETAFYALTHYVPEMASYSSEQKTANAILESQCATSENETLSSLANLINLKHEELANALYRRNSDKLATQDEILKLQDEMEALRLRLKEEARRTGDASLNRLLDEAELSKRPFSVEHLKRHLIETHFSDRVAPEIAKSAISAGYKTFDEREVIKLSDIYQKAKAAPEKCFNISVADSAIIDKGTKASYTYKWLAPSDPDLYTLAMLCGNTCMRPGFAGEAALWESALSDDVALGTILDGEKVIAYYRVNYDKTGKGIYIDTVESRFSKVLNNEEIWLTVRRAVIEIAVSMNKTGRFPVEVINFREERGNRLKTQWNNLPISRKTLKGRAYRNENAPWSYGDDEARIQKEVWKIE